MPDWTADFANDPYHDDDIILELLYKHRDIGVIRQRENGLELLLYAHAENIIIPGEWLLELLAAGNKQLNSS